MSNHYATLCVPRDASATQIRDAYILLARQHHPDAGGENDVFQNITIAYAVLRDQAARRKYDRELTMLAKPCSGCGGTGYTTKVVGIRGTQRTQCHACSGTGVQV